MNTPNFHITNKRILEQRGTKNQVDLYKPYAFLVEKEHQPNGKIAEVATIFLTNRECPFRCLMCDLWKNTTDEVVPVGAIPNQIAYALERLPFAKHIKLYNSGNFFDTKAIPPKDYQAIASMLSGFETVLVENHPKLTSRKVLEFQQMLKPELQVALGLETVHPEVLPLLNKQMTLQDYRDSVEFLNENLIASRAFILLRPPFLSEEEGIEWAKRSIDFAFECGVECCVVIPTRAGNGSMELLEKNGTFNPPKIQSLEEVLDYGISLKSGRVFADTWDLQLFSDCKVCYEQRKRRIDIMNLGQKSVAGVSCSCIA